MALCVNAHIRNRNLGNATALLLRDEPSNASVHLVNKEPFRTHTGKFEHRPQCFADSDIRQVQRFEAFSPSGRLERFLRHIRQNLIQVQCDGCCPILRIFDDNVSAAIDCTEDFAVDTLAFTDRHEKFDPFRPDQESISFLKFSAPDFKDGHRLVAKHNAANVDLAAEGFKKFRKNIARPTGTLIVNT